MYTPNAEEQQFLELSTKFRDELAHVDKQITELKDRRDQLLHLLYGPGPVLTDEGDVEEDTKLALVHRDSAKSESTSEDFSMVDGKLMTASPEEKALRIIRKNQAEGTSRTQLNKALEKYQLGQTGVDNLLKRLKASGKIVSEGRSRGARWYIAE